MDDSELFAVFVADVVNGTESLASNPGYRIESVLGTIQLVDKKLASLPQARVKMVNCRSSSSVTAMRGKLCDKH